MKKTKEKVERVEKRDKTGRYAKGTGGGPGRKKGEPRDIVCKDGKKCSIEALIDDLLSTYTKLGSDKFLHEWALKSHRNLTKFIDILFKFAPQPKDANLSNPTSYELSDRFLPKFEIERIYTDKRPDEYGGTKMKMPRPGDVINKKIKEMQDKLREKDEELRRLKALLNGQDTKELEHEPIPPARLPEHSKAEKQSKDSVNQKSKQEPGKKSTFVTTGDFNREGKLDPNYLKHREQKKKENESKGYGWVD